MEEWIIEGSYVSLKWGPTSLRPCLTIYSKWTLSISSILLMTPFNAAQVFFYLEQNGGSYKCFGLYISLFTNYNYCKEIKYQVSVLVELGEQHS